MVKKSEFDHLNRFDSLQELRAWFLRKAGREEWFGERSFLQYVRGVRDFMQYINVDDRAP